MSKSFYKNSIFYKKYLGPVFIKKQHKQDNFVSLIFLTSSFVKDSSATFIALLFDRLTAITSHPNLNRGFRVFNPTPEVVPVIRTKPLMFLLTSKKDNNKKKSRMIQNHPYQRHITLIMSLEII